MNVKLKKSLVVSAFVVLTILLSQWITASAAQASTDTEVYSALIVVPYTGPHLSILAEMSNGKTCTLNFINPYTIQKTRSSGFYTFVTTPNNFGYYMAARRALEDGSSSDLVEALDDEKSRRKDDEKPSGFEKDLANLLEMVRKKCD